MIKTPIFIISLILLSQAANAAHATIDSVYSFKPGSGQNTGQSPEYFPMNIFGPPDSAATFDLPVMDPKNICSIGLDGEIIVGFKDFVVTDGPGADFTIFENAFLNPATERIFAEPAKVAVSQDGINYVEFPWDSLSLTGCAGKTPTNGKSNPYDPLVSGGDAFDIGQLGLSWIKYIKISDISRVILDNPNHPYYDPIISGFDLDAVAGINLSKETNGVEDNSSFKNTVRVVNSNDILQITYEGTGKSLIIALYSIDGRVIRRFETMQSTELNLGNLEPGPKVLVVSDPIEILLLKIILPYSH